jgi:hypothetical protein
MQAASTRTAGCLPSSAFNAPFGFLYLYVARYTVVPSSIGPDARPPPLSICSFCFLFLFCGLDAALGLVKSC